MHGHIATDGESATKSVYFRLYGSLTVHPHSFSLQSAGHPAPARIRELISLLSKASHSLLIILAIRSSISASRFHVSPSSRPVRADRLRNCTGSHSRVRAYLTDHLAAISAMAWILERGATGL